MSEQIYRRQFGVIKSRDIFVVGLGGAGTWIAFTLLMLGDRVVAVDDDFLEVHNLNRLPYPLTLVEYQKVKAFEYLAEEIGRKENYTGVVGRVTPKNIVSLIRAYFENPRQVYIVLATDDTELENELIKVLSYEVPPHHIIQAKYDIDSVTVAVGGRKSGNIFTADNENRTYALSCVLPPIFLAFLVASIIHGEDFTIPVDYATFTKRIKIKELVMRLFGL